MFQSVAQPLSGHDVSMWYGKLSMRTLCAWKTKDLPVCIYVHPCNSNCSIGLIFVDGLYTLRCFVFVVYVWVQGVAGWFKYLSLGKALL